VIRALIVDDEPLARRGIRTRLERESDIEIAGEAEDGPAAVEAIPALLPDILFLDVQMPGLDGFEVLERVPAEQWPLVVFVTAHDVHALRAFEIHAFDYLLKPYSEERFLECLDRARSAIARGEQAPERQRLRGMLDQVGAARAGGAREYPRRFAVRDRERILLVRTEDLQAIEAAGNYVQLVAAGAKHLLRLTLTEMEEQLDPAKFARIHRSTIVNLDRVKEIRPEPHGDCDVVLDGGAIYRLSRAYRSRLLA
jgi:two-component system LytT family response regulator